VLPAPQQVDICVLRPYSVVMEATTARHQHPDEEVAVRVGEGSWLALEVE